jgi:hypothetical protein
VTDHTEAQENRQEADNAELHRRRASDYSNLRDAFHANPALVLLAAFNVLIICLAVFGIVTTNNRAADEAREQQIRAEGGGQVVACLFALEQVAADTQHEHAKGVSEAHGLQYTARPPSVVTDVEVDEACEGIGKIIDDIIERAREKETTE